VSASPTKISPTSPAFYGKSSSSPLSIIRQGNAAKMSAKIEKIIVRLQEKYSSLSHPQSLFAPLLEASSSEAHMPPPELQKVNSTKRSNKPASSPRGTLNPRPGMRQSTSCSRSRNPFSKQAKAAPEAIWASC
jgi:hypothetical protein